MASSSGEIKTKRQSLSKSGPPAVAKRGEMLVRQAGTASGRREKVQKVKETSVLENMSVLEKPTSHGVGKKEKAKTQYRVQLLAAGGGQEILGDTEQVDHLGEISLRELRQ